LGEEKCTPEKILAARIRKGPRLTLIWGPRMVNPALHPEIAREDESTLDSSPTFQSSRPTSKTILRSKKDGGAVGLTDNPTTLRRWVIAGPDIAKLIGEFEDVSDLEHTTRHSAP